MIICVVIKELHQLNEDHQKCLTAQKAKLEMKEKVDADPVKPHASSQQITEGMSLLKINFCVENKILFCDVQRTMLAKVLPLRLLARTLQAK